MAITIEITEEEQLALDSVTANVKNHFTNKLTPSSLTSLLIIPQFKR